MKKMDSTYSEDKKCRICGFADTKNENIFKSINSKSFLTKILTVYPIILYPNDPLPKNICKKCIYNVTFMYNDIQRVMKTQSKWISNVRSIQPNHNYIRVLDLIENSNHATRESIKATLGEDICKNSINRLLLLDKSEKEKHANLNSKFAQKDTASATCSTSNSVPHSKETATNNANEMQSEKATELKDIKSILEFNGCTLVTVGSKQNSNSSKQNSPEKEGRAMAEPKEEPMDDSDEDNISLSRIASTANANALLSTPPPLTVKCRYCPSQFNSLNTLATHQVVHLRLSIPKIFEKKYLHKSVRRGRLITVQQRKCIRCLNCWRIFGDNKSILDHWSLGECDFYCQLCGKEFAQSPKLLREHVPKTHGISYRSSKLHREHSSVKLLGSLKQTTAEASSDYKLYQAVSEQEPLPFEEEHQVGKRLAQQQQLVETPTSSAKIKSRGALSITPFPSKISKNRIVHTDASVSCNICFKVFQNFKARNSHMRKHKPSYAYGDVVLPPNAGVDLYVKVENDQDVESNSIPLTTNESSQFSNLSDKYKSFLPPTTKMINSTPMATIASSPTTVIRGVRTKFVAPRNNSNTPITVPAKVNDSQKTTSLCTNIPSSAPQASTENIIIKEEPMDDCLPPASVSNETHPSAAFNQRLCFPCGLHFPTPLDLFRHKQHYHGNAFACQHCGESFLSSGDYHLHQMQAHNIYT